MKIFFDLDGTLIDVSLRNYTVYSEVTKNFHGEPLDRSIYWDLKRKKTKWPELLMLSKLLPTLESTYLASFITKIEDINYLKLDTLFPDSLQTLGLLSAAHECYLVSLRRNHRSLLEELSWLQLTPHFTKILSGHSESDGYDVKTQLIQKELDGEPGMIVGDTEADVVTGKELNLKTVALTSGIRDEQFLAALKPDYLLPTIGKLTALQIFIS
jgi:phosphoglycolate phosphatase